MKLINPVSYKEIQLEQLSIMGIGSIFIGIPLLWEELDDGSIQIYTNDWPCTTDPEECIDDTELPFFLMDDTTGVWKTFESIDVHTRNIGKFESEYQRVINEYSEYYITKGLL